LISLGSGGIKPCVATFGADQFQLPDQVAQLQQYFFIFYFTINAGGFLSIITPIFRSEVSCFGEPNCYTLAFGVPTILMVIAIGKLCSQDG
jgi:solute carrier family 15 oligopeptide transporter 1